MDLYGRYLCRTDCVSTPEVLALSFESPLYCAVIECLP
jgi:hypothetical protein